MHTTVYWDSAVLSTAGHLQLMETGIYIVYSCTYVTLTSSARDSIQREYVIGGNFTMFTKLVIFMPGTDLRI